MKVIIPKLVPSLAVLILNDAASVPDSEYVKGPQLASVTVTVPTVVWFSAALKVAAGNDWAADIVTGFGGKTAGKLLG